MAVTVNQSLTIVSTNATNNTAVLRYVVQCTCSAESYNNYDQTGNFVIDNVTYQSTYRLPRNTTTTVFSKDVTVSNASGRTVSASYNFPTTPSGGNKTGNTSVAIPDLTKAPTIKYLRLKSRTVNSLTFEFECDWTDTFYYMLSTASSYTRGTNNLTKGEFTINNLNPNTSYKVEFIARNWINESQDKYVQSLAEVSGTTFDIAKITSLSNFEHGNNANLSISNPANASISLQIKIGNTQILSKTATTGNNVVSFNDTQLDAIYKQYGRNNTVTATFVVTTVNKYTNSKTCTITLKGNQKTVRTNVNGAWKRGKLYTNVNGTWKKAVLWTNVNGTWRRCI